jgi:hypothetical protein
MTDPFEVEMQSKELVRACLIKCFPATSIVFTGLNGRRSNTPFDDTMVAYPHNGSIQEKIRALDVFHDSVFNDLFDKRLKVDVIVSFRGPSPRLDGRHCFLNTTLKRRTELFGQIKIGTFSNYESFGADDGAGGHIIGDGYEVGTGRADFILSGWVSKEKSELIKPFLIDAQKVYEGCGNGKFPERRNEYGVPFYYERIERLCPEYAMIAIT